MTAFFKAFSFPGMTKVFSTENMPNWHKTENFAFNCAISGHFFEMFGTYWAFFVKI